MNEKPEQTERGWTGFITWAAALLVIYVLSVGPAAWLCITIGAAEPILQVLNLAYAPVWWTCSQSEWSMNLYIHYMSLWVDVTP